MGKSNNTTTTQTTPNPAALGAYQGLLGGAQTVVNQNPFQQYGGQFVSPVNAQQYAGIGNINQYSESAQPYIQTAAGLALTGATPISAADIQNYYNPYQQNVISAAEAQFNQQNAQQQQQVLGNAAVQGALGGDRNAVAQATLAGQQQLQEAPVIAGLESQGFNQAAQLALAAKQQQAQGAYSLGNLGVAGQQAGLSGAGAQVQAGTLEQQTQQQLDAALYNQFLMQQAFPYQQMQWLAGIDTGVGSQMGGTSQTVGPPPSLLSQLGGLGLAGVGILGGTGGFGPQGYLKTMFSKDGGRINGFADGDAPEFTPQELNLYQHHVANAGGSGKVANPDGSMSTVYQAVVTGPNGKFYNIPTIWGGKVLSPDDAAQQAQRTGWDKWPSYDTPEAADAQYEKLHGYMAIAPYLDRHSGGGIPGFDTGGMAGFASPLYGGVGFIPKSQLTRGMGPPHPPGVPTQSQAPQMIADAQKFAQAMKGNWFANNAPTGVPAGGAGGQAGGLTADIPEEAKGGRIELRRLAVGGPITAAGFGMGSLMPRGYQEGGTVLPDGTIDHGTITLDPEDMPGQGITPEVLAAQREADNAARALTLPREITGGVGLPGNALAYDQAGAPVAGVGAAPSVADRIISRYGHGLPAATVPQASGASVPWSSSSSNLWPSLMAAGLGMMASHSPFPGVAIGEGGLRGLQTYEGLGREQRAEAMSQQKVQMAADNLMLRADQEQKRLAQASRPYEEMTAAQKAHIKQEQDKFDYTRMQPVKIGTKEDAYGNKTDVYAVKDPASGAYHAIDPTTGQLVETPIGAGFKTTPPSGVSGVADTGAGARVIPAIETLTPEKAAAAGLPTGLNPPDPPRDDDFLAKLPPGQAATVKGLADYAINPNSLSIKGGHREQLIGLTRQYDPTYDQSLFNAKNRAVTEFYAGGPMSPAGTMTAGNTALLHANDMLESINKMRDQPGMIGRLGYGIGEAGVPFVSAIANRLTNAAVRGTPEGAALTQFETARQRFTEEVTKFYAGSQGSEAERDRAIQLLNSAKSLPELRAAIQMDARLMRDKVDNMQGRLIQAMSPAAWRRAVMQDPSSVLLYKNSRQAFDNIMRGGSAPIGQQPTTPAATSGAGFTGRTATNPQTGITLRERADGQWVP